MKQPNLQRNKVYKIYPTFIKSLDRTVLFTRLVKFISLVKLDNGTEWYVIEEMTNGPANSFGKNGYLWEVGDRMLHEVSKWGFQEIRKK